MTLTRVTNDVSRNWVDLLQFSSVHFISCALNRPLLDAERCVASHNKHLLVYFDDDDDYCY